MAGAKQLNILGRVLLIQEQYEHIRKYLAWVPRTSSKKVKQFWVHTMKDLKMEREFLLDTFALDAKYNKGVEKLVIKHINEKQVREK